MSINDQTGTSTLWFDRFNRIEEVDHPQGNVTVYRYEREHRLKSLWPPFSNEVRYRYDLVGRLIAVETAYGGVEYLYEHSTNLLQQIKLTNGVTTVYLYDHQKRLKKVAHQRSDQSVIATVSYEYDPSGNCIRREEESDQGNQVTEYRYDKLNRLTQTSNGDKSEKYTYDGFGNRLCLETESNRITYVYDEKNQLKSAGDILFEYDLNGNLIKKSSKGNETSYRYDDEDRLIEYRDNAHQVTYEYDGMGKRVSKTIDGRRFQLFNSMHNAKTQVLDVVDDQNELRESYIYGLGRVMQVMDGKPVFFLHDRPLGNVIAVVNHEQKVLNAYAYSAFAVPRVIKEEIPCSYLYGDEEYQKETGLIFLRNRYYDPMMGRFITRDPKLGSILNPQSLNPYSYVNNNPINSYDPLGLDQEFVAAAYPGGTITKDGTSLGGHAFGVVVQDNGSRKIFGMYPEGLRDNDEIYPDSIFHRWTVTDEQADLIENLFRSETWSARNNCVDAVCKALDLIGVEHPSFKTLGMVSLPTKFMLWLESLSGKSDFRDNLQQNVNFIYDADLFYPRVWPSGEVVQPVNLIPKQDLGGVSLNKTALLLGEISDLVGATYDQAQGQLILIGRKNRSLPAMKMDDLAVAVRSVYGLGEKPPADPGVSIDWNPENNRLIKKGKSLLPLPVRYEGVTENTQFGQVMFEADRLLKCLTFGEDNITKKPFHVQLAGFKSLYEIRNKHKKVSDLDCKFTMNRMWFVPDKITLVEGRDQQSMQFSETKMKVLNEVTYKGRGISDPDAEQFARYLTDHYDELSRQFPVLSELKRLGKITGVVKWMKENSIPFDLTLFEKYKPQYCPTPFSTPAMTKYIVKDGMQFFPYSGGVTLHLSEANFFRTVEEELDYFHSSVISSRGSDNVFTWTVPSSDALIAVAQTVQKMPRSGNVKKAFSDMRYPLLGCDHFALRRIYDSFNEETNGFGVGWEIDLPCLRFPEAKQWHWIHELTKAICCHPKILLRRHGQEEGYQFIGCDADGCLIYISQKGDYRLVEESGDFRLEKGGKNAAIFSAKGKPLKLWDTRRQIVELKYHDEMLSALVHSNGSRIELTWNQGRVVHVSGPGGKWLSYEYDDKQRLSRVFDAAGTRTTYVYDTDDLLSGIFDAQNSRIFSAKYDDYHRAVVEQNGSEMINRDFDGASLVEEEQGGVRAKSVFSPSGQLVHASDSASRSVSVEYDQCGVRPRVVKNSLGQQSEFVYGNDGRIARIKGVQGSERCFWYDQSGRVKVLQRNGVFEMFDYDQDGFVTKVYHDVNIDETSSGSLTYRLNPHDVTEYVYDATSHRPVEVKRDGERIKLFEYSSDGLLAQETDPYGYAIRREYDAAFRIASVSDERVKKKFSYNLRDQLTSIEYPEGKKEYTYDECGRLSEMQEINGGITCFEYDTAGKLVKITDATGGVTKYRYDESGNLMRILLPNETYKELQYDQLQRVIGDD